MKKRIVTTLEWHCEAWITNLGQDVDSFYEKPYWKEETVCMRRFKIESVSDRLMLNLNDVPLGKFAIEFSFEVYGNDKCINIAKRVKRRLTGEGLPFRGIHENRFVIAYFKPENGEHFTHTALKVATRLFKAFGICQYNWAKFSITQETECWNPANNRWDSYAQHIKNANNDILNGPTKTS